MCSSPAYSSLERPAYAHWPPPDHAIGSLTTVISYPDLCDEADVAQDALSEGVLIESDVHGTGYRLIRTPGANNLPLVARFPESRCPLEALCEPDKERRSNVGSFRRVLVAEDHKATRQMLIQMLRGWGFEAVPAGDGTEVLRIVDQTQAPELIILSRKLPGIDAIELCRRMTNRQSDYSPYILVLAMQNDRQQIVDALEAGAAEYLIRPFEAQELRARLIVATRILKRQESLITSRNRFRLLATKDALTGIWNRRSIYQILKDELDCAARSERTTGVLLLDLDYFKRVNDTYGHLAGDAVLQEISRRLKNALRPYDSIGRYGGEEFLIVVPGSIAEELCELAERLRKAIEREPVGVGANQIRITLSMGAAVASPRDKSLAHILAAADAALYDAKGFGRNRVVYGAQQSSQPVQSRHLNAWWPANALPGQE